MPLVRPHLTSVFVAALTLSTAGHASADDVPPAPDEGGPRAFEVTGVATRLNLREEPSESARVIGGLAAGTLLDNLGCLRTAERVWCDVQEQGGGPRGYVARAFLTPARSPDGSVQTGVDTSALRAGAGDFDATGEIPCAQSRGQPMGYCAFGVARGGGGYATVVVTRPGGMQRTIFFSNGAAIGAGTSEADPGGAFVAERDGDLSLIRIGDERYEIPDAVVFGG